MVAFGLALRCEFTSDLGIMAANACPLDILSKLLFSVALLEEAPFLLLLLLLRQREKEMKQEKVLRCARLYRIDVPDVGVADFGRRGRVRTNSILFTLVFFYLVHSRLFVQEIRFNPLLTLK